MINIDINDGLEEVIINNDPNRVFKFNPRDYNIIGKVANLEKTLKEKFSNINLEGNEEEVWNNIMVLDKEFKAALDEIFNSNVSDALFNGANCLLTVDGQPIIFDFFEKLAPIITSKIEEEMKASENRTSKYTAKYKNQQAQENYEKLVEDTTKE